MERWESLSGLGENGGVFVTPQHTFGADALLLAGFVPAGFAEVCEFGTGCGVISLLLYRQAVAAGVAPPHITALDIQPAAAALATRSVATNGLQENITVLTADWRTAPLKERAFDAVVCNPPYFPANSGKPSPNEARRLARQEESPAALGELCQAAARLLKHGGGFFLCHRPERLADLFSALRASGLEPKRLQLVQHRPDCSPFLVLCEARRGGNPSLTIEPTLLG